MRIKSVDCARDLRRRPSRRARQTHARARTQYARTISMRATWDQQRHGRGAPTRDSCASRALKITHADDGGQKQQVFVWWLVFNPCRLSRSKFGSFSFFSFLFETIWVV